MAKVDVAALEAQEKEEQKIKDKIGISERTVAGRRLFKGRFLDYEYDNYGECLMANTDENRQAENRKKGLDEFGRGPEQIALLNKRIALVKEREDLLKKATAISVKINELKTSPPVEKEEKKVKK